ncbi:hypothetical protein A1O1_07635 [Capronia coronata CBS 617.96]|uniref:D-serine dehydratase n=1 Tax=Capronia coronata CBS 617.96 TaxID=1182541 RepID=W9XX63_9EURO|nr:uncharacterized protein A1O1_07635 [Capronia coronata CBS 617.96]EXJ81571.1 hypothetical protein A1O1_07635 [Capronia coronata CBS 617.96]
MGSISHDTLATGSPYPSHLQQFIGKHKSELPSPSLCLSLPVMKRNARSFHEKVKKSGVDFRAHVKTNKTEAVSRILLGDVTSKVIISTLREARGLDSLITEGVVKDLLYGVPICPSVVPELDQLSRKVTTRLLIDHIDHVSILSQYVRCRENWGKPWTVFIKLDMGGRRAGLPLDSPELKKLVRAVEEAPNVEIYGFYSYSAKTANRWTVEMAETVLQNHITGVLAATELLSDPTKPLTLSIGSSPTARVIRSIKEQVASNITFEIHAGNLGTFIYNDLQQLSTGTIDSSNLAMSVIAEVCSVYSERNEALINAGVLALTREPGELSGIARVRDKKKKGWIVGRVSQEHGILVYDGDDNQRAQDVWTIGDKVELDVQHTCIVGAMYGWHFITDEDGTVRDILFPWKWW